MKKFHQISRRSFSLKKKIQRQDQDLCLTTISKRNQLVIRTWNSQDVWKFLSIPLQEEDSLYNSIPQIRLKMLRYKLINNWELNLKIKDLFFAESNFKKIDYCQTITFKKGVPSTWSWDSLELEDDRKETFHLWLFIFITEGMRNLLNDWGKKN